MKDTAHYRGAYNSWFSNSYEAVTHIIGGPTAFLQDVAGLQAGPQANQIYWNTSKDLKGLVKLLESPEVVSVEANQDALAQIVGGITAH
jgi:hypothetical protein